MNKKLTRIIVIVVCAVLVLSAGITMAVVLPKNCGKNQAFDPETRPVVFAIGDLDRKFNPFFSTSANDGTIAGMTQISMLSTDKDGNIVAGKDEPCAVLDYKYETTGSGDNQITTYEFVIKNGIKFSDGEDLTIKDVLFNLYVYLDPLYTGSSTIYSTKIQGLNAYKEQDINITDDSTQDSSSTFQAKAFSRLMEVRNYLSDRKNDNDKNYDKAPGTVKPDIAIIKELFRKEVESDWSTVGALSDYQEEYSFTELWQAYLLHENLVKVQTEVSSNGSIKERKDANGKYLTTLDESDNGYTRIVMEAATDEKVAAKLVELGLSDTEANRKLASDELKKAAAIDLVYVANAEGGNAKLYEVATYWQTASEVLTLFANEERSKFLEDKLHGGEMEVPTISGITTYRTSSFTGGLEHQTISGEHEVLKIVINGVDPKALMNFAFTVAPMHYYSTPELTEKALDELKTKTTDYTEFGVKYGDNDFFTKVLQSDRNNGVPVGAGAYKASNEAHDGNPTVESFYRLNMVYYERNEYFETVGMDGSGDTDIQNAKIKYLNYAVTQDDNIITALTSNGGQIDFGEPQGTKANMDVIKSTSFLNYNDVWTSGYGYIGINPKFVPELEIRQVIMMCMEPEVIVRNYYGSDLADTIYRPMSKTNWAYPDNVKRHDSIPFTPPSSDKARKKLQDLMRQAGYSQGTDGIWANTAKSRKLEFTFTIAGSSKDHPAFDMLSDAAARLESIGFKITVKTDINALSQLSTGNLAVWAAAWSAAIDPDMYQVYHKDSRATSVNNWYYDGIVTNLSGEYTREQAIVNELSDKIDDARSTNNQTDRKALYKQCLDLVMDLAVEFPTYQRKDIFCYNNERIDVNSLTPANELTCYNGPYAKIWLVNYN